MWKKLAAAAVLTTALASPAGATLVEIDGWAIDDGLLTRDTDTGLDWLDLTETAGHSINDMFRSEVGGLLDDGFRIATMAEVLDLYDHAGFIITSGSQPFPYGIGAINLPGGELLIDLLGCTGCGFGQNSSWALGLAPPDDAFRSQFEASPPTGGFRFLDHNYDTKDAFTAVFLVRSTPAQDALIAGPRISFEGINLPEPGAFALLGLGLLGLAARRFV